MTASTTQRRIAVLGATGSIGRATLKVIAALRESDPGRSWQAVTISGHDNLDLLVEQARSLAPSLRRVIASNADHAESLSAQLSSGVELDCGPEALIRAAVEPDVDTVVAAIVGRAGLESTLAAVQAGKRVALANKETLVVAGPVVMAAAKETGAELLPVDSEHSAIFQCLHPSTRSVRRIILTASGGPFRDWSSDRLAAATVPQALAHPVWKMGRKISIDSATMMNKALEIIEARWLFDIPADKIEVVVHPQSIIHSMVEFEDGSVIAQMSPPDMQLPIQYALTFPERMAGPSPRMDFRRSCELSLQPADPERFPALALGFEVAAAGGTAGVVLNGANETAVALFLDGKIRFTDIPEICRRTLDDHDHESAPDLSRLIHLDQWSRRRAAELAAFSPFPRSSIV